MTTKLQQKKVLAIATTALVGVVVAGCGGGGNDASNDLPTGIKQLGTTVYPAIAVGTGATAATQDLLTAGMGRTGLGAAAAPAYADPLNPHRAGTAPQRHFLQLPRHSRPQCKWWLRPPVWPQHHCCWGGHGQRRADPRA